MKTMHRLILAALALLCLPAAASAATCTWNGTAGNWDNSNTASWSCGHVPTSADDVVFDGTSGTAAVTICNTSAPSDCPNGSNVVDVASITFGSYGGGLDFGTYNPNVTAGYVNGSGSGTRSFNGGTGTWTLTSSSVSTLWNFSTTTNLSPFTAPGAIVVNPSSYNGAGGVNFGNLTYNDFTLENGYWALGQNATVNGTFTVGPAPCTVKWVNSTMSIATFVSGGTDISNMVGIFASGAGSGISLTNAVSNGQWIALAGIAFSGASATFTNSIDLGENSFAAGGGISPPASGSGVPGFIGD